MSDFNFETSDDLEALIDYGKKYGVIADKRFSPDKIRDMIRAEKRVIEARPTEKDKASEQPMMLQIHKTEGDTGSIDVPVSVNGKTWLIKRGFEVKVPAYVVEVLKNAVKEIYTPVDPSDITKGIERREVPAYPFTAHPA
jgi:hypothetical protein